MIYTSTLHTCACAGVFIYFLATIVFFSRKRKYIYTRINDNEYLFYYIIALASPFQHEYYHHRYYYYYIMYCFCSIAKHAKDTRKYARITLCHSSSYHIYIVYISTHIAVFGLILVLLSSHIFYIIIIIYSKWLINYVMCCAVLRRCVIVVVVFVFFFISSLTGSLTSRWLMIQWKNSSFLFIARNFFMWLFFVLLNGSGYFLYRVTCRKENFPQNKNVCAGWTILSARGNK